MQCQHDQHILTHEWDLCSDCCRPTCQECAVIFPKACGPLYNHLSEETSSALESKPNDRRHDDESNPSSSEGFVQAQSDPASFGYREDDVVSLDEDYDYGLDGPELIWQSLFKDEVQPGDSTIVPIVNVVMQFIGTRDMISNRELGSLVAEAAGNAMCCMWLIGHMQ